MHIIKKSRAYGAFEYTLIVSLAIIVALIVFNGVKGKTGSFNWIDSAKGKADSMIGTGPVDPVIPVGGSIKLVFPGATPTIDINEGETITKQKVLDLITNNNGEVKNASGDIIVYDIEDINYNPFRVPTAYIQFKIITTEGNIVSQLQVNQLTELEAGCIIPPDSHFIGETDGTFQYRGGSVCVKVPTVIKGVAITSYSKMFEYSSVKKVISKNTNITKMDYMFNEAYANEIDLSYLNTSNVTNMSNMFRGSKSKKINISNFDTSKVTDMEYMFYYSSLESLSIDNFNTTNVKNMSMMFASIPKLTNLNLSKFNTSSVTNMGNMFLESQILEIDLSNFNTSNVVSMNSMFNNCKAKVIIFGEDFNTSNVTTMSQMFKDTQALSLNLLGFNTSKVDRMEYMFKNCKTINLDLSSFDASNVTVFSHMFYDSEATNINLSSFNTSKVVYTDGMFYNSKAAILDLSSFDLSGMDYINTRMSNMFYGITATTRYAKTIEDANKLNNSATNISGLLFTVKP